MSPDELQTASARVDAILHDARPRHCTAESDREDREERDTAVLFAARHLTGEFEGEEKIAMMNNFDIEEVFANPPAVFLAAKADAPAPQAAASAPPSPPARRKRSDAGIPRKPAAPPAESAPVQAGVAQTQANRLRILLEDVIAAERTYWQAEANRNKANIAYNAYVEALTRPAPQTAEVK